MLTSRKSGTVSRRYTAIVVATLFVLDVLDNAYNLFVRERDRTSGQDIQLESE